MIAVIKTGGKQYIVREQQKLRIEKLDQAEAGKKIVFSDVFLVASNPETVSVGAPQVKGATVEAEVIRQGKADKIRVVHYKNKTRHKRSVGHRQPFTEVRIEKIVA